MQAEEIFSRKGEKYLRNRTSARFRPALSGLRLEEALAANADLPQIYFLKEELSQFWQQTDLKTAQGSLYDRLERAESLNISSLTKFCQTIRDHLNGLFSWYATPISTGPLEGINNKIKTLKRQSYGFRDSEYFRLKILGIHRSRYALVG